MSKLIVNSWSDVQASLRVAYKISNHALACTSDHELANYLTPNNPIDNYYIFMSSLVT